MLIAHAELEGGAVTDVRVENGRIADVGSLRPRAGEVRIDAGGSLLLPGLHDHHIHLAALAASLESVRCGPPEVMGRQALAEALAGPGDGWLRGIGYHESVSGMLDAAMLDDMVAHRPVRLQHRSGRMWFLNSAALEILLADRPPPPGLERDGSRFTGRLFDEDRWLIAALASNPPALDAVGATLARAGVTGVTDMTPANDCVMARHFGAEAARGALPQKILLAGMPTLTASELGGARLGAVKLHLHENALPPFDQIVGLIRGAHATGRSIAVHCVTEVELVFALAALDSAGAGPGDRIEHASVATDDAIEEIGRLGLSVVVQPHFLSERGDAYRADVDQRLQSILYRLRSFADAGIPLAGGSDAPFGAPDPWASMAAAVHRRTAAGVLMGPQEALHPEAALGLYLSDPEKIGERRRIEPGAAADLCLIDRCWAAARINLAQVAVVATWIDGRPVFDRIDEAPGERGCRTNPAS